ncbi:MAG: hypothetical protein IT357_07420 [Gemmatimonadaceae bacterium]|nr:hypothetical protein [Gemmatimonadaceae bacterium]
MGEKGYNTNLAAEYHVMSVLHRLGMNASLTLGNKKSVDIVVIPGPGESITLDVKGVAGKNDWLVGRQPREPRENHFAILVGFGGTIAELQTVPEVWVLPDAQFLSLIQTASTGNAWFIRRKDMKSESMKAYLNAWAQLESQYRERGG